MSIKAFNEAARALVIWTALRGDVAHRSEDAKERQAADDHMGLLTPVIKGVLTDTGFANTVAAQQLYGGHGYIAEHGMEQFVRDSRIAMIYEGANGIQALDLVGRKLGRDGGRAVMAFFNEVGGFIKENGSEAMKPYVGPLAAALGQLQQATMWFAQNGARQTRQCRRRRHRLHAHVRPGRARLHVGADRQDRAGQARRRQRRRAAAQRQARHRPLLHAAHAAGNRRPA